MTVDWQKCWRRIQELLRSPAAQLRSHGWVFYVAALLGILLAFILLVWLFDWKISWVFATAVPLLYLFLCGYRKNRGIGVTEAVILLLCFVLIGIGPQVVEKKLCSWNFILEEMVKKIREVRTPWWSVIVDGTPGDPKNLKSQRANYETTTDMSPEVEKLLAQRQPLNVIRNGDFLIPLVSTLSPWGHGQYTDLLRARLQRQDIIWINFLDADIDVQIAQTEIGPALRIENRNELVNNKRVDHKVGIMEQYIRCEPGEYRLSLSARGKDVEPNALFCATTDDWSPRDKNNRSRRLDLPPAGTTTFPWRHFESGTKGVRVNN